VKVEVPEFTHSLKLAEARIGNRFALNLPSSLRVEGLVGAQQDKSSELRLRSSIRTLLLFSSVSKNGITQAEAQFPLGDVVAQV